MVCNDLLQLPFVAVVLAVLGGGLRRLVDDNLAALEDGGIKASAGIDVANV